MSRSWGQIASRKRHVLRQMLIERDGTQCFHCGRYTRLPEGHGDHPPETLTIDHYPVPRRNLPKTEWLNPARAVIACLGCNRSTDGQGARS